MYFLKSNYIYFHFSLLQWEIFQKEFLYPNCNNNFQLSWLFGHIYMCTDAYFMLNSSKDCAYYIDDVVDAHMWLLPDNADGEHDDFGTAPCC